MFDFCFKGSNENKLSSLFDGFDPKLATSVKKSKTSSVSTTAFNQKGQLLHNYYKMKNNLQPFYLTLFFPDRFKALPIY